MTVKETVLESDYRPPSKKSTESSNYRKTAWETSGLRHFRTKSRVDIRRLREIQANLADVSYSPDQTKPSPSASPNQDLIDWINDKNDGILQAVIGTPDKNQLRSGEAGQIQGLIYVYADDPQRICMLRAQGVIGNRTEVHVLEFLWGKRKGAEPQQMSSAIRQFTGQIFEETTLFDTEASHPSPQVIFTAYIKPSNISSAKAALAAGFKKVSSEPIDYLYVTATTKEGKTVDEHRSLGLHDIYILDYEAYMAKLYEKGDTYFINLTKASTEPA
jgi:hypothetical protein